MAPSGKRGDNTEQPRRATGARTGELVLANSGLPQPLILRQGRVRPVETAGIPLGMFPDTEYAEVRHPVEGGDLIVLASDGVTECANADGEEYGAGRLQRMLAECGGSSADRAVEHIVSDLMQFSGDGQVQDDQTLIAFRILPGSTKPEE